MNIYSDLNYHNLIYNINNYNSGNNLNNTKSLNQNFELDEESKNKFIIEDTEKTNKGNDDFSKNNENKIFDNKKYEDNNENENNISKSSESEFVY